MRDREFHDKDRLDQDAFENPLAHAEFEAPEDGPRDCRRNHWAMKVVPTCNDIHELTLGRPRTNKNARRNNQQNCYVKYLR